MQCVVLAGGKSRRMGKNKALLPVQGEPMIQRVIRTCQMLTENIVVISDNPPKYEFLNQTILSDRYTQMGPLAGLETAMYHSDEEWFLIAPCDSPSLSPDVYKDLLAKRYKYDIVIPVFQGKEQPLHGIYHRRCYETIMGQLEGESLRMRDLFEKHHTRYVDEFDASISPKTLEYHFTNLNYPQEYDNWGDSV